MGMAWDAYKDEVFQTIMDMMSENCYMEEREKYQYDDTALTRFIDDVYRDIYGPLTGADTGSYYCSSARAKEALASFIFDADFNEGLVAWELDKAFYECISRGEYEHAVDLARELAWLEFHNEAIKFFKEL